jgi:hypothetical protein
MERGTQGDAINPWGVRLFQILDGFEPSTPSAQSAYDKSLELTSTREEARRDRIHGAQGVIPTPLWIVLIVISAVIFFYMLFFADSAERAKTQALLMGSVTAVISIMLLLLLFLNSPFGSGVGALRPVAMERSLRVVDEALGALGVSGKGVQMPCDAGGRSR